MAEKSFSEEICEQLRREIRGLERAAKNKRELLAKLEGLHLPAWILGIRKDAMAQTDKE